MSKLGSTSPQAAGDFGSDSVRVTTAVGAIVGLILVLLGLILKLVYEAWGFAYFTPVWLMALGALAVAFFIFFNIEWLGQVVTGRAALSGILVAVMSAGAVALWVGGNYLFNYPGTFRLRFWNGKALKNRLYWSGDFTKTQRFRLNEKTRAQMDLLEGELKITVIGRASQEEGPDLDDLLRLYREASSRVSLEFLMPTDKKSDFKRKQLAEKLNMKPDDLEWRSVALSYKDRFKYLSLREFWEIRPRAYMQRVMQDRVFKGEEVITSAVYEMLDTEKAKVYFVIDHGEMDPDQRAPRGLSSAAGVLDRSNIDWQTMDLRTKNEIPEDATLVIICGPKRALQDSEVAVLQKYLDGKGRLLLCLDEFRPEVNLGLEGFLSRVGIVAGRDIVVENDPGFYWGRYRNLYIGKELGFHPMVEKLRDSNVRPTFSGARSLKRLADYKGDFSADALCSGSGKSYGETDLEAYRGGRAVFDEKSDNEGPVNYAMACWEGRAPMPGGHMNKKLGRVVVFGDSDWCSNALIDMVPDNRTLFMAAVNWLAGRERRIAIEPKKADEARFSMRPGQRKMSLIVLWIVPGLLALAAGLVLWVRRR